MPNLPTSLHRFVSMPNLPTSLYISADETYMELTHGLNQWPALVNVRANLLDGPFAGWYSNGQGKMRSVNLHALH